MKSRIFTVLIALGLTMTAILVIKPVLAHSYWNNDTEDEFIPHMMEEWYENDTMPYWDHNGTYHMPHWGEEGELLEGDSSWMPHMYSSAEGDHCEGPEDGDYSGMMGQGYNGMMGGRYGGMMGGISRSNPNRATYGSN